MPLLHHQIHHSNRWFARTLTIHRLFAFVLPFVLGLVPALAQNELKGLSGVNVGVLLDESVQKQHPDLQRAIQRDVEIKLRVAGMEILSAADLMSKPRITISISTTTTLASSSCLLLLNQPFWNGIKLRGFRRPHGSEKGSLFLL